LFIAGAPDARRLHYAAAAAASLSAQQLPYNFVGRCQNRVIPDPLQIGELLFCRRAFRSSSNEIKKESSRLLWVLRA
jgi:hypothetical protein